MAITYPRELHSYALPTCKFTLDPGTATARHKKGLAGTVSQVREPLWLAEFETSPMFREDRAGWITWLETLNGGLKHFLAWDASQPQPLAYPNGVPSIIDTSWNGTGTVASLSTAGQIDVSGVTVGFVLTAGDKVGLVQSGKYGLYRVIEDATADGLGDISISVTPLVQDSFTTAATAVLYRPKVKLQVDPGSVSFEGGVFASPVSFSAFQVLV